METKKFIQKFPEITEQEQLSNEVLDSIEAGCAESCSQGCKRKNLKNNNTMKEPEKVAVTSQTTQQLATSN